jgi:hypothetical protein
MAPEAAFERETFNPFGVGDGEVTTFTVSVYVVVAVAVGRTPTNMIAVIAIRRLSCVVRLIFFHPSGGRAQHRGA